MRLRVKTLFPTAAILLGLALAAPTACRSGRGPTEGAPDEPEQLSSLCGKGAGESSRDQIGWLDVEATDVTPRFRELLERVRAGENVVPPEAAGYLWLLVPGLFSNLYPDYMKGNVEALRELDLRFQEVEVAPDGPVATAAQVLRDVLFAELAEGQQAVILGHSKGGVDVSAALALYPEVHSRVRSFVAIQAPYAGSPVANDLAHCPSLGSTAAFFVRILGNDPEAAVELSYETRQEFIAEHPYPTEIPTLSLATSRVDWRSIVWMTGKYVRDQYGVESDGLVVPADAVLPGSQVIHLGDMDHAESVLSGVPGFINYRSKEVTQVLMAMALAL
ncbi:MAG: lipase [Myxococcota bacterium]|nr:lipase [Myxococcota bacterium]